MKSHLGTVNVRLTGVLLFWVCSFVHISAQCDPPDEIPEVNCQNAPQTCLIDACFSTDELFSPGHGGFCDGNPFDGIDSTGVQNPQYFLLEATDTTMIIDMTINSCSSGGQLQAAIIDVSNNLAGCDSWENGDVIDCDGGFSTSTTLIAEPVVIGNVYLFLIDGFSGAECEYTINNSSGVFEPQLQGELDPSQTVFQDPACPGDELWFATVGPAVGGAFGYEWDGMPAPGGGTQIVTSTLTTLDIDTDGFNGIPEDAAPGFYTVTVTPFSGCDVGDVPVEFTFEVVAVPDSFPPDTILCPEEYVSGFDWLGLNITAAGTYTVTIENTQGCPFDVTKVFNAYPDVTPGQVDTLICGLTFDYEGVNYSVAGTYQLDYPGQSVNGCDSSAVLEVAFAYVEAMPEYFCDIGGDFVLQSFISNLVPTNTIPMFIWRNEFGDVVSNDADWMTQTPGTYTLEIVIEVNGFQCSYSGFDPVEIILQDIVPAPPVLLSADSSICAGEIPLFEIVPDVNGEIVDYNWTGPADAPEAGGNGTTNIAYNWSSSLGGQVCVSWSNNCGPSAPTCFNVEVINQPSAFFQVMSSPVCIDEVANIMFDGTSTLNTEYDWDFDGGIVVTGGTNVVGPHEIYWATTGTKTITLKVVEPGCDTVEYAQDVIVENLETPVLNCSSTTSSVTVTWNNVPGATSYDVNVLSPPAQVGVRVDPNTFEVTGLASGTAVEIEVIANGAGACPPRPDTIICSADDCPAPTWAIVPGDTTVCEGSGTFSYSAVVNGMAATGTWSGPGIVDPVNGVFDPDSSGTGMHTIRFDYNDGSCAFSFTRDVNVIELPTSPFTADQVICQLDEATITYTGSASAGAMYTWGFDGGQIISGTGQGPYQIQWNVAGPKTITLSVTENGCTSAASQEVVQVDPALGSFNLNCSPTTTSVTISWDSVANSVAYSVLSLQGPLGTFNGTTYTVIGLTPGDVVEIEVSASGSGLCPAVRDTISCVAQNCPSPSITIGPIDTSICLTSSSQPFDMDVVVTGGTGSGQWSGPGIVDAVAGTFDPSVSGPGPHQIVYEYNDQSCTFNEQTTVTVYDLPTASIVASEFILTCDNGNQVTLDGSGSSAPTGQINYVWGTVDGTILTRTDSAGIIAGAPGTYVLFVGDAVSGCTASDSVVITQDANLPTADAGRDTTLTCLTTEVMLGGNSTSGPDITYLWTTTGGNILSDPTLSTIRVDRAGTYELLLNDALNGCEARSSVTVFEDFSTPMPMLAVDGVLTCDNQVVNISSIVTGGNGQSMYQWSTVDGTIDGVDNIDAVRAISPGTYVLVVTDMQNGCVDSSDIEVMADSDVIAALDVTESDPSCFGEVNGSIAITNVTGGSTPFNYNWSNGGVDASITGLRAGGYSVTVTDNNGCSFVQSFDLVEPALLTADIGPDLKVNRDDSVTIELLTSADAAALASIIWSGPVPPCDGCFAITFSAQTSGVVAVDLVDTSGCRASASLQLSVVTDRTVFAPNVFSPNDDGANDKFNLFGPSITQVSEFRIFDRWGDLVYSTEQLVPNDTGMGWDGTLNGEQLNPGVFVFYAKITHDDGFEEELIGDVTLIR